MEIESIFTLLVNSIILLSLIGWPMLVGWMVWDDIRYRETDGIVGKILHVISAMIMQCMIIALGVAAIWIYIFIVNNIWTSVFGGAV